MAGQNNLDYLVAQALTTVNSWVAVTPQVSLLQIQGIVAQLPAAVTANRTVLEAENHRLRSRNGQLSSEIQSSRSGIYFNTSNSNSTFTVHSNGRSFRFDPSAVPGMQSELTQLRQKDTAQKTEITRLLKIIQDLRAGMQSQSNTKLEIENRRLLVENRKLLDETAQWRQRNGTGEHNKLRSMNGGLNRQVTLLQRELEQLKSGMHGSSHISSGSHAFNAPPGRRKAVPNARTGEALPPVVSQQSRLCHEPQAVTYDSRLRASTPGTWRTSSEEAWREPATMSKWKDSAISTPLAMSDAQSRMSRMSPSLDPRRLSRSPSSSNFASYAKKGNASTTNIKSEAIEECNTARVPLECERASTTEREGVISRDAGAETVQSALALTSEAACPELPQVDDATMSALTKKRAASAELEDGTIKKAKPETVADASASQVDISWSEPVDRKDALLGASAKKRAASEELDGATIKKVKSETGLPSAAMTYGDAVDELISEVMAELD